jgi:gas vesicle protein
VAWFTLAGALGGVLVTSIVGLSTAMLNHRRQGQQAQVSRRWQLQDADRQLQQDRAGRHREQLRETYTAYWSTWNRFSHQLQALTAAVRDRGSPADARSQLMLDEPELARDVRTAELEWRTVAEVLLMICGPGVTTRRSATSR